MSVVIETTIGDITIDLFTDERPIACLNFLKLCKLKYYNYNLFHTIQQGFIAQTGDPTGVGDGGSSIWGVIADQRKRFFEAESLPKIHHTTVGLVSLVGAGKHLVGSQFFFTLGENLTSLDGQHSVIGEVVEGHEVLRQLNETIVDENFRPYQDVRITHTVILDDPFPDPRGFRDPSRSPSPTAERLKNGRIAADEDIDDTEGKSMEEIQEMLAEREAKARATILEIVGDLPDAEMAPPENVLFVCKLNPVTSDDDLEIIFSRFGKVKGCEVIRDRKTGDSLQYAFVEFEDQKSCEAAYFKMDNVLIDDRRIHVDFSQSVSKVKWKGKGRGIEGDSKGLDFNALKVKEEPGNSNTSRRKYTKEGSKIGENMYHRYVEKRHSRSPERTYAESADRRRAREQRHSEQRNQRKRTRSRSFDRSLHKNERTEANKNNYYKSKEKHYRQRSTSPKFRNRREKGTSRENRSSYRAHEDIYSPERRHEKYNAKKSNIKYDSERKIKRYSPQRNSDRCKSPLMKREYKSENVSKTNTKNTPKKKSKRDTSTSDGSSTSSDSTSGSCETSSSTSESTSEEERKKKLKKNKKHKSKLTKNKSKKHKK